METEREGFANEHIYRLVYKEEGVYIHAEWEDHTDLLLVEAPIVVYDLKRRGIKGFSPGDIVVRVRMRQSAIRVGDAQEEQVVPSSAFVQISRDGLSATMQLLPPSTTGEKTSAEDILKQIKEEWHITEGLHTAAIESAVKNEKYYEVVEIARGIPAVKGKDGFLNILFETEHSYAPRVLEDGSADYKNLNLFSGVTKGDVLVVRVPPEAGTPGKKVTGEEIPAPTGIEAKMPKGKNVAVGEDGNSLIATKSGRVDYAKGIVQVSDIYAIPGDVDMSVGNLEFEGDVRIGGGVIAGLSVKAAGSIEVGECVEAAALTAGKDIVLKKGVQGMDKAVLKAGGNIISKFIERSVVEAEGSVFSDSIVHSTVTAKESIILKGKRSRAIGGTLRASRELRVRTLGTPSGEKTIVELGVAPQMRAQITELNAKLAQFKTQLDKIDNMTRISRVGEGDARQEILEKLLAGREGLLEEYDAVQAEIEEKKKKMEEMSGAALHVYGDAFHDVKITIDSATYTIRDPIEFATFRYREGEVRFGACEVSER